MSCRAAFPLLVLVLAGCGAGSSFDAAEPDRQSRPEAAANPAPADLEKQSRSFGAAAGLDASARPAPQPAPTPADPRMIIRTGHASVEVDSLEVAIRRVGELAIGAGGYVASSSIQTGERAPRSATLEVKIPADRYQGAFDRLGEIGKVTAAGTSAQDVGEEFVDVTARVANAKRLEARLVELLATRTGKLEEVLGVERELARIREEIERYQGRLRWLTTQVAMSTLSVSVYEPGPLVGGPGENVIVNALEQSWRNFVSVVAGGIALAGGLIPVAAFGGLLALVGRAVWRRIRLGRQAVSPSASQTA